MRDLVKIYSGSSGYFSDQSFKYLSRCLSKNLRSYNIEYRTSDSKYDYKEYSNLYALKYAISFFSVPLKSFAFSFDICGPRPLPLGILFHLLKIFF